MLGRTVHVLDITTDLQVPSFVAVSVAPSGDGERPVLGFGTHFDAGAAIQRALTEMTQGLYGAGELPGVMDASRIAAAIESPWPSRAEAYLLTDPEAPLKTAADYAAAPTGNLKLVVESCVEHAARAGLEMCVLDLTREHIGVPVVKVIVPQLASWWRRLGFHRLYEGPVRSGWLTEPCREEEMNPHSIVV